MSSPRTVTPVDEIAERHLDRTVAHDPVLATVIGIPGHDHRLPALDPDWYAVRSAERIATLREVSGAEPIDASDRITLAALRQNLEIDEQLRGLGLEESCLNNVASPLQWVRDVFDLVPTASSDDWAVVATRLAAVPSAIDGYVASLRFAAARGSVVARRQIQSGIRQCADNIGADGFFEAFARNAGREDGGALPPALQSDLERNAERAGAAYARLAGFLENELLPAGRDRDAVGREEYAVRSRDFVGAEVDLDEAYAWGQDELARITAEMGQLADRIRSGASVPEAIDVLERDTARQVEGTEALQRWMQDKSDAAVAALAGTYFDIPEPIRRLECRIAPTHSGVIYYTPPSADLVTRPGRMWWSVPEGVTRFGTWKELTTVYHEGVPGHHLQMAQTVYRRDLLNRWRRLGCWTSGYGEGWALYAEKLMADLGFLEDPGDYLGMLDSQSLRAARVVLDIGIHCELPAPDEVGGGAWDYDKAWRFLTAHCTSAEPIRRFELERYLGWPGQAPSYMLGQRFWLQLREEVRAREGAAFELKAFHRRALDVGSVGLDVLRQTMLGEFD